MGHDIEKRSDVDSHGVKASEAAVDIGDRRGIDTKGYQDSSSTTDEGAGGMVEGQLFSMTDLDPALDAKMRLVNQVADAQRDYLRTRH
jgi:hypothetical protein